VRAPETQAAPGQAGSANWVEHGTAPDRIIASQVDNGQVPRTRRLCQYPKVARYNPNAATSFTCR
jgi:feruloyl esterase